MADKMSDPEKPVFDEDNGVFVYGDSSVPYCFYVVSSAVIIDEEKDNDN